MIQTRLGNLRLVAGSSFNASSVRYATRVTRDPNRLSLFPTRMADVDGSHIMLVSSDVDFHGAALVQDRI